MNSFRPPGLTAYCCVLAGALLLGHLCVAPLPTATPAAAQMQGADSKAVRALIAQLGSASYDQRENAHKKLTAMGEEILQFLEMAARENLDAEVRQRAALLIVKNDPMVLDLLASIDGNPHHRQTADVCGVLFAKPSPELVRRLKYVRQTGVALRAASEESRPLDERGGTSGDAAKSAAASRFLDFVKARLHVPLPDWWEERVRMGPESENVPFHSVALDGHRVTMPAHITIERQGKEILLLIKRKTVVLPADIASYLDESQYHGLSASMEQNVCFIAFPRPMGRGGFSYRMLAFNPGNGNIRWGTVVWDHGALPGCLTGMRREDEQVSIVEHGNLVFVFGSQVNRVFASSNINIEAFDRTTGNNRFRFTAWSR